MKFFSWKFCINILDVFVSDRNWKFCWDKFNDWSIIWLCIPQVFHSFCWFPCYWNCYLNYHCFTFQGLYQGFTDSGPTSSGYHELMSPRTQRSSKSSNSTDSWFHGLGTDGTRQGCTDDDDIILVCSFRWDGNNGNSIIFPHVLVFVLISRSAWINWNCFNFILWNSTRHDLNWVIQSKEHGHPFDLDLVTKLGGHLCDQSWHWPRTVYFRFNGLQLWLKPDHFWTGRPFLPTVLQPSSNRPSWTGC